MKSKPVTGFRAPEGTDRQAAWDALTQAQGLSWRKESAGKYRREDGVTIRALSVQEANTATGGRVNHTGYRRVYAAFDARGVPMRSWPELVCGPSLYRALKALNRAELIQ